jgi:hypothetical protein
MSIPEDYVWLRVKLKLDRLRVKAFIGDNTNSTPCLEINLERASTLFTHRRMGLSAHIEVPVFEVYGNGGTLLGISKPRERESCTYPGSCFSTTLEAKF